MPKLIDADKLQDWIDRTEFAFYGRYREIGDGVVKALGMLEDQLDSGNFDPTPPVQPDIKLGDRVKHTDLKKRGPGIVRLVMGKKAKVYFEKTEIGQPIQGYYRLDKLEVIKDDESK